MQYVIWHHLSMKLLREVILPVDVPFFHVDRSIPAEIRKENECMKVFPTGALKSLQAVCGLYKHNYELMLHKIVSFIKAGNDPYFGLDVTLTSRVFMTSL